MATDNSKKPPASDPVEPLAEEDEKTSFTVDTETSKIIEVPSINRLLNRGMLRNKKKQQTRTITRTDPETPETNTAISKPSIQPPSGPPASLPQIKEQTLTETESSLKPGLDNTQGTRPFTKPATRHSKGNAPKLKVWKSESIQASEEPLFKGIGKLMELGAGGILFLSIAPPPEGSNLPIFTAAGAVGPETKVKIWSGLVWNPTIAPDLWNQFVTQGRIELGASSEQTGQLKYSSVRSAFGVHRSEHLILIRVGSEKACRGLVAAVSSTSLALYINDVIPLLTAPSTPKKSKLPK